MYLDLDNPQGLYSESSAASGSNSDFIIPGSQNLWRQCRVYVSVQDGSLLNSYSVYIANKSSGPAIVRGDCFSEEHALASFSGITVSEVDGRLVVSVNTIFSAGKTLAISVGNILIF